MSYIATFAGRLEYRPLGYVSATNLLTDRGFDDCSVIERDDDEFILTFFGTARGLGHHIDTLVGWAHGGSVAYTSNDGAWHGVLATAGETIVEVLLDEWVERQSFDPHLAAHEPDRGSFGGQSAYADAYAGWKVEVEQLFREVGVDGLDVARAVANSTPPDAPEASAADETAPVDADSIDIQVATSSDGLSATVVADDDSGDSAQPLVLEESWLTWAEVAEQVETNPDWSLPEPLRTALFKQFHPEDA